MDYKSMALGKDGTLKMNEQEMDAKSIKSTKSTRSTKGGKKKQGGKEGQVEGDDTLQAQAKKLDKRLAELDHEIDNDPAYLAVVEENARRKFGERFVTEEAIPDNLHEDTTFQEQDELHRKEIQIMGQRRIQLECRAQIMALREELMEQRCQVEAMMADQKIRERKMMLRTRQAMWKIKLEDDHQTQVEKQFENKVEETIKHEPEVDTAKRTEDWVMRSVSVPAEGSVKKGPPSETGSQIRIRELEQKLQETKKQLELQKCKDYEQMQATKIPGGIAQLKRLGLMPNHIPEDGGIPGNTIPPNAAEMKKLQEGATMGGKQLNDISKQIDLDEQYGCGPNCMTEKGKVKSGKYVKANINLKYQEQWPHVNVLRKYAKRGSFEQMEFETFVAGETRIIMTMQDRIAAAGRLQFLCKIAHWVCRCGDWQAVRGLYEAVLESIELGEETWLSDFSHYEVMLPAPVKSEKERKQNKQDLYWCKQYQRGSCKENSPHLVQIRMDEPPVPVLHICAACYQRDGRRLEHAEQDCVHKEK